jgi:hypothetical protein
MKRFTLAVLFLACLTPFTQAAEKLKELVIRPGETVYARFETTPKKITLVQISKEPDERAQVVFTLQREPEKRALKLTVENKFSHDLSYRAEVRSLVAKRERPMRVTPVVAGKLAFENLPDLVDEIAAFDFKLQK